MTGRPPTSTGTSAGAAARRSDWPAIHRLAAVAVHDAGDLEPPAGVDARRRIQIEVLALRPQPRDPDRARRPTAARSPTCSCATPCGRSPYRFRPLKRPDQRDASGCRTARARARSRGSSARSAPALDERGAQRSRRPDRAGPAPVARRLDDRPEVVRREPRVAVLHAPEIPELAADLARRSDRRLLPEDVDRLGRRLELRQRSLSS